METVFTTMQDNGVKPTLKKTEFYQCVLNDRVKEACMQPHEFKNVMYLYHDIVYGDVFLAWSGDGSNRSIYFGIKGDEFND